MSTSYRSPSLALAFAALMVAPLFLALPGTATPPAFVEDWERGTDGWTVTGTSATVVCKDNGTACSLQFAPPCCGENRSTVSRDLALPLTGPTVISFLFRGDSTWGDTDTSIGVTLNGGGRLSLTLTDWWSPNNRLSLTSSETGSHRDFARWESEDTWHRASLFLHPGRDIAWATLTDAEGAHLGTSDAVGIPAGSDTLESLSLYGVSWSTFTQVFHYDDLTVAPADLTAPTAPAHLKVTAPSRGQLALTWSPPAYDADGIAAYRVYRGVDRENLTLHATVTGETRFNDTGLPDGVSYFYAVTAVSESGAESPLSAPAQGATWNLPSKPVLRAREEPAQVRLDWSAPSHNGGARTTELRLYRGLSPDTLSLYLAIPTHESWTYRYFDDNVTVGTPYYYRLSAVNSIGEGDPSEIVEAIPGRPFRPYWTALVPGNGAVSLAWTSGDDGRPLPTHYELDRIHGNVTTTRIVNGTSFRDTGLINGEAYAFVVRAVSSAGTSRNSYQVTLIPTLTPSSVQNLTVMHRSSGDEVLTWSPPLENADQVVAYTLSRYNRTTWSWDTLATVDTDTHTFTDSTLGTERSATYRIIAVGADGTTSTPAMRWHFRPDTPDAPRDVTATGGTREITVTWKAPIYQGASNVTTYCIYRTTADLVEQSLRCVPWWVTTVKDALVVPGMPYTYSVRAKNPHGQSEAGTSARAGAFFI